MLFIREEMTELDRKKVNALQLSKIYFYSEMDPKEWIINKDKNIYLIYLMSTDGTHAPADFVETITFLLNWKGNPIVIEMADERKGAIITYTIVGMTKFQELEVKMDGILSNLIDALTIYSNGQVEIYF